MIRVVRTIEYLYDNDVKMREDQDRWTTKLKTRHMTCRTTGVFDAGELLLPDTYEPPTIGWWAS